MNFNVSTKPLANALDLGVVNQNVSKFYQKSCLAQVTASSKELKINLEAANVLSEIRLKGSGDTDQTVTIFVDCLLLKQLVSTFDAAVTAFEFTEGGLILHSGKSKFTLPKMIDGSELELTSPSDDEAETVIDIDKSDWKFIKEHQMYAIAMSFIHPVYTRVWVGQDGDVLVGDFDNSMFTHSKKSKLGSTCLLSDTIINLFNTLPEGAKLRKLANSYVIKVSTDGYEYMSEFKPIYESEEGVGSYNSDIILDMMVKDEANGLKVNTNVINKFLNQAALLSNSTEDTIKFTVRDGNIGLVDNNVDCKVPVEGITEAYEVEFKTVLLKAVISNFDEETVTISPMKQDDVVAGIIVWSKNMTVVLAGIDE